jgi:predicted amidohydrolase
MKVATASPVYPESLNDALHQVEKLVKEAAKKGAEIVCFPESYLPGYPGMGAEKHPAKHLQSALDKVCAIAAENSIAVIIPMDWYHDDSFLNVAFVISAKGEVLGYQTKNQLDPSEDNTWKAGTERHLFEVNGVKFGLTICHEGFRYPESVRWAAMNGAQIVFHPNCTGSNETGSIPTEWGHKDSPYYEKAQMMRAMENTIYVVTSNYTFRYPESAGAIIAPDGQCLAYQTYAVPGVTVADIDPKKATGLLAKRYRSHLYK